MRKRIEQPMAKRSSPGPVAPVGPPPAKVSPVTWKSLLVLLSTGGALTYYFREEKKKAMNAAMSTTQGVGRPSIGGPFELASTTGGRLSNTDLLGRWMYVYFGFTFCPDVCPMELDKMGGVLNRLEKKHKATDIVPLFITIDPSRDDLKTISEYLKDFHPRFIGLTGTQDEINAVAKAYRVHVSQGPPTGDDPNEYLVDHSIIVYLMDPEGNFSAFYGQNSTEEEVANDIEKRMKTWKPGNQSVA